MRRDLACALALLLIAVAYFGLARDIGETALSDSVGPAGLPLIYAIVLAGIAVTLAVLAALRAWLAATGAPAPSRDTGDTAAPAPRRLLRAAGAFAIGIAYVALVPLAGYAITTALAIVAMAMYQGEKLSWRLAIIACVGAVILYLLFDVALGVDMPALWTG